MHDSMQYDPIHGQGHELFKVGYPAVLTQSINRSRISVVHTFDWSWKLPVVVCFLTAEILFC